MSRRRAAKPKMIEIGIRSLTGDVVCEIRIIARADEWRGGMTTALAAATGRMYQRIDEHYKGSVPPTEFVGATSGGGSE